MGGVAAAFTALPEKLPKSGPVRDTDPMVSGCCPPLALPRRSLGGEIIGFDEKTGQFVQASAGVGATRVVRYPYYASAGMGSVSDVALGGLALTTALGLAFLFGVLVGQSWGYTDGVAHAKEYDCDL